MPPVSPALGRRTRAGDRYNASSLYQIGQSGRYAAVSRRVDAFVGNVPSDIDDPYDPLKGFRHSVAAVT